MGGEGCARCAVPSCSFHLPTDVCLRVPVSVVVAVRDSVSRWSKDTKYVYRHYATLFFIFAVDESESELGMLDLVQVFVETLDKCFESVCELDLIFNSDKVCECVPPLSPGLLGCLCACVCMCTTTRRDVIASSPPPRVPLACTVACVAHATPAVSLPALSIP